MSNNKEYLIEIIYKKLKNISSRQINLEQTQLIEFINSLINNNYPYQ